MGHVKHSLWGFSDLGLSGWFLSGEGALLPKVTNPQAPSAASAPLGTSNDNGPKALCFLLLAVSTLFS